MKDRQLHQAILLTLLFIGLAMFYGCQTVPKDTTQGVYAAGWTLVGATNSVADLKDAGVLKGEDLANAKSILDQAETAYRSARAALKQGKPNDAASYIRLAQSLLNQLASLLAAQGR